MRRLNWISRNKFFDYVTAISSSSRLLPTQLCLCKRVSLRGCWHHSVYELLVEHIGNGTQTQPTKETAGLQVNVDVKRIDDNGFISLKVNRS